MSRGVLVWLAFGLAASIASAQPLAPAPQPPDASVQPAPGAQLPLDLPYIDSEGLPVTLRQAFNDQPVVLVLGYYRCPQLCGLLMHGLLQALHEGGLPRERYRVLRVSIDPTETVADARARRDADVAYLHFLEGAEPAAPPLALQALTGPAASVQALARAMGYRFEPSRDRDDEGATFAHPAVAVVVTPEGRVSRYFGGAQFDPSDLRAALTQAGLGHIDSRPTPADPVALLCAHIDPRLGRHSAAVLHGLQVMGVLLVLALATLYWRQTTRGSR
jgi:protein SCO1